ncbi:MAG: hypothetical protein L3K14_04275 [Thermoplasmata archaeon]|nr:hypothetical protein [Thermoplasmata archaeon]
MQTPSHLRGPEVEEWIARTLSALGKRAATEIRDHDFGGPSMDFRPLFDSFARDAGLLPAALRVQAPKGSDLMLDPAVEGLLGRPNSMYRCSGALLLTYLFRGWMTDSDVCRAWATKLLCVRLFDLLDDIVDEAHLDENEVGQAIAETLHSLTAPKSDFEVLHERLRTRWQGLTVEWAAEVVELVSRIRASLLSAPQFSVVAQSFRSENEGFAAGQAVSRCLRRPKVDVSQVRDLAWGLPSPAADVPWVDRYVGELTWIGALTLVDLACASLLPRDFDLPRHLEAWYYLDIVVGAIDHFVTREADLRRGIVNSVTLALAHDREAEAGRADASAPCPRMQDYERLFARWAEYSRRAVSLQAPGSEHAEVDVRGLTVLIPVVMFLQGGSEQRDSLHAYLRVLGAALRSASSPSTGAGTFEPTPLPTIRPRIRSRDRPPGCSDFSLLVP